MNLEAFGLGHTNEWVRVMLGLWGFWSFPWPWIRKP